MIMWALIIITVAYTATVTVVPGLSTCHLLGQQLAIAITAEPRTIEHFTIICMPRFMPLVKDDPDLTPDPERRDDT